MNKGLERHVSSYQNISILFCFGSKHVPLVVVVVVVEVVVVVVVVVVELNVVVFVTVM